MGGWMYTAYLYQDLCRSFFCAHVYLSKSWYNKLRESKYVSTIPTHKPTYSHILFFYVASVGFIFDGWNGFLVMNKWSIFELFCVIDIVIKCKLNTEINKTSTYFIPKAKPKLIFLFLDVYDKTVYVEFSTTTRCII